MSILSESLNRPAYKPETVGVSTPSGLYRPTWAEISTRAFASNVRQLKLLFGPGVALLAVLKADAYGHSAASLAKIAIENGAAMTGVSSIEEGIALREAHISHPILLLGSIYPLENFSAALDHDLIPTVSSLESARTLLEVAKSKRKKASFHLKVDTGMGRIGVSPIGAKAILGWLRDQSEIDLVGMYSHFAAADSDPAMVQDQLTQFLNVREVARGFGFQHTKFHIANSAGAIRYPDARLDMVRPGLAMYGALTSATPDSLQLSAVLSLHTRIVFLKKVPAGTTISYGATFTTSRESEIATLPIGYADGVPRELSNKGFVLVKGRRCPIVGRVTMDQIMIDVTGVPADIGEPVVLIGRQNDASIAISDWADWAGTIPYEILCGISKRVPRVIV